jgi:hypothetical protein
MRVIFCQHSHHIATRDGLLQLAWLAVSNVHHLTPLYGIDAFELTFANLHFFTFVDSLVSNISNE